jgi:hypothetical protein
MYVAGVIGLWRGPITSASNCERGKIVFKGLPTLVQDPA